MSHKALRRQKQALSQSTTSSSCTLVTPRPSSVRVDDGIAFWEVFCAALLGASKLLYPRVSGLFALFADRLLSLIFVGKLPGQPWRLSVGWPGQHTREREAAVCEPLSEPAVQSFSTALLH